MERERDIEAWFRDYHRDVYSFLAYLLGGRDVEDLVQETFIRAFNGMDQYSGRSTPKTWLFAIARNVARDYVRKRNRTPFVGDITGVEQTTDVTPELSVTLTETQSEVLAAVQNLSPNYRDVVLMRGMFDLSVQETAEALNWTPTRVRVTFFRALKALKSELIGDKGAESHEWTL